MKKKVLNHTTTIIFIIMCIILSISFAILIPIIFRPFYYCSIKLLNIEKQSGFTYSEIKEAFDGVMDFIWEGKDFYVGVLNYSEEGVLRLLYELPGPVQELPAESLRQFERFPDQQ